MRLTEYGLRHRRGVWLLAIGCLIGQPGRAAQRPASAVADRRQVFESEALASRALQHVHALCGRLRSLVNRQAVISVCSRDEPREESPTTREVRVDPQGSSSSERNWQSLHVAAIESLEILNLLVGFGAASPPWIKDLSGVLGAAPTLTTTVTFLREHPTALAFLRWPDEGAPFEAQVLDAFEGDTLPLPQSVDMEYLRERLRGIRMIWAVTERPTSIPADDFRVASEELLSFHATLRRVKAIDPTLALVAGSDEEEGTGFREVTAHDSDVVLIEKALSEVEDLAVWEGDTAAALRLLNEIEQFSKHQIAHLEDPAQKGLFGRLLSRVTDVHRQMAAAPNHFARAARSRAWCDASRTAHDSLMKMLGDSLVVTIPGNDIGVSVPNAKLDIVASVVAPDHGAKDVAPWLYGVQVSVLQPVKSDAHDQTAAVTGLPLALINETASIKHVRRFVHDDTEIPDYELSTAHFLNITPGTYRVELVPWGSGQVPAAWPPADSAPPSIRSSRWERVMASGRAIWHGVWSALRRSATTPFFTTVINGAA